LEVEYTEPAQLADGDGGLRRHDRVHRSGDYRHLEAVRVDLPSGGHLFEPARTPARHDRDVVERVGAAAALASADLDFRHPPSLFGADSRPRSRPPPADYRPQ